MPTSSLWRLSSTIPAWSRGGSLCSLWTCSPHPPCGGCPPLYLHDLLEVLHDLSVEMPTSSLWRLSSTIPAWSRGGSSCSLCRDAHTRGLQFYTFFGISIGIKRRLIDIAKKITFYFLQNVWKCTVFFAFAFKVCKKCYYDPKKFFLEKYQYGYQKNAEFYADFEFVDAGFQKYP